MFESRRLFAAGLALACLLTTCAAGAADIPDGLAATRGLAQAGAIKLGLQRIDTLQPADAVAPRWADWERLRLELLAGADRNDELLKRATAWPAGLPAGTRAELHAVAADAALAVGRGAAARDHAGRVLWTPGVSAARQREMRLVVIRSYVREARADDAYRSMLRFQQDYRSLDAATAAKVPLPVGQLRLPVSTWLDHSENQPGKPEADLTNPIGC